jgi:glycosyltransferase involved in cell wall biosynthesis
LRKLVKTEPFDVIIGFTDIPNIVCYGALIQLSRRPPFIATIHSNLRVRDEKIGLTWKNRLIRFFHKRTCYFADKAVVVSSDAAKSIEDYYGLDGSNVLRIYNPILETVRAKPAEGRIGLPLKLVAAGRLTQAKNYPLMIRTVKHLIEEHSTPCHLSIYGEGELRSEIEKLIDELGVKGAVTLYGFVNDLRARLAENDIFLLTSTWEGFGNVLVEALDAGLQVVSTDCPSGPREILADGKYGYLVPCNNAKQMARAVLKIAERPITPPIDDLREHLNQFLNTHIAKEYSRLFTILVH